MSTVRFDDGNGNVSEINLEEYGLSIDDLRKAISLIRLYSVEGYKHFSIHHKGYNIDKEVVDADRALIERVLPLFEMSLDITD